MTPVHVAIFAAEGFEGGGALLCIVITISHSTRYGQCTLGVVVNKKEIIKVIHGSLLNLLYVW